MSLSERQKITEVRMEPIKEKPNKIIESSSSHCTRKQKWTQNKCQACTKTEKETHF